MSVIARLRRFRHKLSSVLRRLPKPTKNTCHLLSVVSTRSARHTKSRRVDTPSQRAYTEDQSKSASDTGPSQILPRTAMRFPKESQFGLEPACMEWFMKNHCLHCSIGRSGPHATASDFGQIPRQIPIADLLRNPYCDQGRDTAAVSSRTPAGSTLPIANDAPQIEMLAKRFDSGDKFSEPHDRSQILRIP
jgi:hypothetical protein